METVFAWFWARDWKESVEKLCFLGDTPVAGGRAEKASIARVRSAWAKFRELAPALKVKGKVHKTCVQRVMVYSSET